MTVESASVTRLASLPSVSTLVGTRVYLEALPQSPTMPCVRVALVDDPTSYQLRGPTGLGQARVQVDAYAATDSGVVGLAEAIKGDGKGRQASGLSGWIGTVGSPAFEVLGCHRIDRRRSFDPEERHVLRISQDYRVQYREA
jgi:hypothetical protein